MKICVRVFHGAQVDAAASIAIARARQRALTERVPRRPSGPVRALKLAHQFILHLISSKTIDIDCRRSIGGQSVRGARPQPAFVIMVGLSGELQLFDWQLAF